MVSIFWHRPKRSRPLGTRMLIAQIFKPPHTLFGESASRTALSNPWLPLVLIYFEWRDTENQQFVHAPIVPSDPLVSRGCSVVTRPLISRCILSSSTL